MTAVLSDKQARSIREAVARINLWHGSVRSGKTTSSVIAWLHFIATAPPGDLLMVGKTKDTLERNIVHGEMATLLGDLHRKAVEHTRGANTAIILGRLVYLVGANDAKAESRIRGATLVGAYVDEASLVPEGFWAMLLSRLSVPGARLYATTNPDSPNHWLKRDFLDNAELDLASWHFVLDDNPALDPTYVANLKAEYTGLWYQRFVLGLWVLAEGAIYDMFDTGRHVTKALPAMHAWWLGVDYGTTNPLVALLIGHGHDDRLHVAREWRWDSRRRRRQLTDAQYSTALRKWLTNPAGELLDMERTFVDPSAASFIAQLWQDGWPGVHGADNTVDDGIRSVASLLGGDRLRVHDSCTGLIDEMLGYVWDPKAQQRGEDRPLKVDDHGPDALRYAVMGTRRVWRRWIAADLPEAA